MNSSTITKEIGSRIKQIREKASLTQAEVAKSANMHVNYFAKIERGEVNTSIIKLYKITKALKAKASDIFPF